MIEFSWKEIVEILDDAELKEKDRVIIEKDNYKLEIWLEYNPDYGEYEYEWYLYKNDELIDKVKFPAPIGREELAYDIEDYLDENPYAKAELYRLEKYLKSLGIKKLGDLFKLHEQKSRLLEKYKKLAKEITIFESMPENKK